MKIIGRLYAHEWPLFFTGLLGLALALLCAGAMAVHGNVVEPEGNLYKAASFCAAVGIFQLTLALIVGVAGFSPVGLLVWRFVLIALTLFGYGVETIQIFRGLDPRFSRVAGPTDQMMGGIFFLSAIGIMICFLVLTLRFFFKPSTPLVLALRYGVATSMLGFGIGIAMSALQGPSFGPAGNLLPLHAAGFHGLQAVPLVALILGWAGSPESRTKRAVHAAGLLWLLLCGAIASQSFSGRHLLEPAIASAVATLVLGVFAVVLARALADLRQSGRWPEVLGA